MHRQVGPPQILVRGDLSRCPVQVHNGRRGAPVHLTDLLPPQPLLVAERSRSGGALERALAVAARCWRREQGVELRLVEEADLRTVLRDRRGPVPRRLRFLPCMGSVSFRFRRGPG
ncbi:MAG: hypothetical protein M3065_20775 [Actinomycetota bacterium]|nr:hypothetical protein [Actinomycetota bacterium]